jgi:hypothetical protein
LRESLSTYAVLEQNPRENHYGTVQLFNQGVKVEVMSLGKQRLLLADRF